MKFTNKVLEAFDEPDKVIFDEMTQGLGFRSTAKGRGAWLFRFTSPVTGKRREKSLGSFPKVTLPRAREAARQLYIVVEAGGDPIQAAQDAKAAETHKANLPTFERVAREAHAAKVGGFKNAKHQAQWLSSLEMYAFPALGGMVLSDIKARHIADCLRPIWHDKAETASRVKQRIDAVFEYGIAHELVEASPVSSVKALLHAQKAKVTHQPSMPWRDVPEFLAAHVRAREVRDTLKAAVEFAILTAARSGEVREATWVEIDLEAALWTVPADRMKARVEHYVPLSDRAVEMLRELKAAGLHDTIVFPSPRKLFFSDMAPTEFLRGIGARSATPGRTATLHGFRSSFRDWCADNERDRDTAERALAHTVGNAVEAAYLRSVLLRQRRQLMQAWSEFLLDEKVAEKEQHDPRRRAA